MTERNIFNMFNKSKNVLEPCELQEWAVIERA